MSILPTALPALTAHPISLTILALALLALLYALYLRLLPRPFPGIPHNKAVTSSLLGDIIPFVSSNKAPSDWILSQANSHAGPICQVFLEPPLLSGGRNAPWIIVSDFREAQDVLMRRKGFDRSDMAIALLSSIAPEHHINLKMGTVWKAHRRLIQDLMLPSFLHGMAGPNIYRSALRLVDLWREKEHRAGGKSFSAMQDISNMALDAVLDFTFADAFPHRVLPATLEHLVSPPPSGGLATFSPGAQHDPVQFDDPPLDISLQSFNRASEAVGELFESPVPTLSWNMMRMKPRERKLIKARESAVKEQVRQALERLPHFGAGDSGVKSAIDMMMLRERQTAEKEGREPVYLSSGILAEIIGFIIAGHDTTSTTLLWLTKFLTDSPSIQTTLRNALTAAHTSAHAERRIPSFQEIINTSIPYLDATLEEGLRRSNTIPFLERQCDHDTILLGHHFPKGTTFLFLNRGASFTQPAHHIDESLRSQSAVEAKGHSRTEWDAQDMDAFRPERWLDESGDFDSQAGPTIPFGLGTRGCYGRRLAYLEMRIVITLLIWNFELQSCPKEVSSYDTKETLTLKPQQCYVRLRQTGLADGEETYEK